MEQGQEPGLPEGVTTVHQLVAATLEATLEVHLPAGHPALQGHGGAGDNGDTPPLLPPEAPPCYSQEGHSPASSGG